MRDVITGLSERGTEFYPDAPLSRYSSFRIGGSADLYILPRSEDELACVLSLLAESGIKTLVTGNMTNLLFSDEGYRGAVVSLKRMCAVSVRGNTVTAEAGASLSSVADTARRNSLSGFEPLFGIPGTVGGAVFMNAGAFGSSVSDILVSSRYIKDGGTFTLKKEDHAFSYRDSAYRTLGGTIISASFELTPGDGGEISRRMSEIIAKRSASQPLDMPSAGSVFKRPEGHFAGKLIEDAGLKGFSCGGAQVSVKHAGFIVNAGGATAADVKALIAAIKKRVYEDSGVRLEEEIITVEP